MKDRGLQNIIMVELFKDRRSLALQLRDRIREMIREKYYRTGDKLPTEEKLAEMFHVSRASVREALKLLEEERSISVRHGLGRFVALDSSSLLSEDVTRLESVTEMARSLGIEIETEVIAFLKKEADEIVQARLNLEPGTCVYFLERVRKAGGEPVIVSIDIFPCSLTPKNLDPSLFDGSLIAVMEGSWNTRLSYSRTTISAEMLDPDLCCRIQVGPAYLWVLLEQINFNDQNHPVLYSKDYHRSDKFRFHVVRRKR